jgi:hypothetical protein
MARFGVGPRRFREGVLLAVLWGWISACQSPVSEEARVAARDRDPSAPCEQNEAREFFCDDLLPLTSSRPAPEPYDNCPSTVDVHPGAYKPIGSVAGFDKGFTEYTRQRQPPGHSCCYSWCTKVDVADPSRAAQPVCRDAYGIQESFCLRELENGTSEPATSPYDRCPLALKPPEASSFSAPASVLLDVTQTTQARRDSKLAECCYGWCSKAPAGTMLKAHPKTR